MRLTNCQATPQYISYLSADNPGRSVASGASVDGVPVTNAFLPGAIRALTAGTIHLRLTPAELDFLKKLILQSGEEPVVRQIPKPAPPPPKIKVKLEAIEATEVLKAQPVGKPVVMDAMATLAANAEAMLAEQKELE